jgi:hypothetical protein
MSDTVGPYDAKAGILAAHCETVRTDAVHAALLQFIPHGPDLIALDGRHHAHEPARWPVRPRPADVGHTPGEVEASR